VYENQGLFEKAAESYHQYMRLYPDDVDAYGNLLNSLLALQRFDQVRQSIQQVQSRNQDNLVLHNALYALDFLRGDSAAIAKQQQWFAGRPEENVGLSLASDTEAYASHLGNARELTKRESLGNVQREIALSRSFSAGERHRAEAEARKWYLKSSDVWNEWNRRGAATPESEIERHKVERRLAQIGSVSDLQRNLSSVAPEQDKPLPTSN
jgi:tetratricopeptide (TPR) repeat protein